MTIDEINIICDKAKIRGDGVYSYKQFLYVVKDHNFIAFSDYYGNCYQRAGMFNVSIGKVDRENRKNKLKEWMKGKEQ